MNPYYTDFSEYMSRFYGQRKVQKLSVNTGSGCPNRNGTLGRGGCIYCDNRSFTPSYCFETKGIRDQLEAGKRFFGRKYPDMNYLAYFQSYTGTYGKTASELAAQLDEASGTDGIVGIIIGTRPDCISREITETLVDVNRRCHVFVELGVESMHDETLRAVNRGHDSEASRQAIHHLASSGLHVGVHLIAGLPGEDSADVIDTVRLVCAMPVESVKMHHLQVLRGSILQRKIESGELSVRTYTPEEYLELCVEIIRTVPRRIAIERFLASAPSETVVSPHWGLKNHEFTNRLINKLRHENE